jgi:hypothetical protein
MGTNGEMRKEHKQNFVGKPEGKRPLGRPRRGWEDSIKIDLEGNSVWNGLLWHGIGTDDGLL